VADLVDVFCVLVAPGGGDELQGIKRGIMELADLLVVNKADGDLAPAAGRAAADYEHALHLMRPRWSAWSARVLTCSALEGRGMPELWSAMEDFHGAVSASGELAARRQEQAVAWLWSEVRDVLVSRFRADAEVGTRLPTLEREVAEGHRSVASAARELLEAFGVTVEPEL
jgi:LAO/AO transport system kinase